MFLLCSENKTCTVITLKPHSALVNRPVPWNKEFGQMASPLRLVEGDGMDKTKALEAALGQI